MDPIARLPGRFAREGGGVAAVEFALLLPLMMALYVGLAEMARGLQSKRTLDTYTRTIADLTGRVQPTDMSPIFAAANLVARPFDASTIDAKISAVGVYLVNGTYQAYVCSSVGNKSNNARTVKDAIVPSTTYGNTLPDAFKADQARYILAEVNAPFVLMLGNALLSFTGVKTVSSFTSVIAWPERGDTEIVLPNGKACPTDPTKWS